MTTEHRRGRPVGSGRNDSPHLRRVAEILIDNPGMKPTAAMNRLIRASKWSETEPTLRRRWQVKWKSQSEALLASVHKERADREARRQQQSSTYSPQYGNLYSSIGDAIRAIDTFGGIGSLTRSLSSHELGLSSRLDALNNAGLGMPDHLAKIGAAAGNLQAACGLSKATEQLEKADKAHRQLTDLIKGDHGLGDPFRLSKILGGRGY